MAYEDRISDSMGRARGGENCAYFPLRLAFLAEYPKESAYPQS